MLANLADQQGSDDAFRLYALDQFLLLDGIESLPWIGF